MFIAVLQSLIPPKIHLPSAILEATSPGDR